MLASPFPTELCSEQNNEVQQVPLGSAHAVQLIQCQRARHVVVVCPTAGGSTVRAMVRGSSI